MLMHQHPGARVGLVGGGGGPASNIPRQTGPAGTGTVIKAEVGL